LIQPLLLGANKKIEGRIIASFLMITGVGLFGTSTGFITSWFMGEKKKEEK
jgi:voltage-gated potassium channel